MEWGEKEEGEERLEMGLGRLEDCEMELVMISLGAGAWRRGWSSWTRRW